MISGQLSLPYLLDAMPALVAIHEGPDHTYVYSNPRHDAAVGGRALIGRTLREAMDEMSDRRTLNLFDRVYRTGETVERDEFAATLRGSDAAGPQTRHFRQSLLPWRGDDGAIRGVLSIVHDITDQVRDRRRAEERQCELEFALEAGGGVGTWDWDVEGDTVVVDPRFGRLFGLDEAEVLGGLPLQRFVDAIHTDDQAHVGRAIEKAVAGGGDYLQDFRVRNAEGRYRWVSARGRCFHRPDGRPSRFPGVVVDITDQIEARQRNEAAAAALRQSEERRRRAMEAGKVGTFEFFPQEQRAVWDPMTLAIFGMRTDGRPHLDEISAAVHPDDRAVWMEDLSRALEPTGGGRHSVEIRIWHDETASWRWIAGEGRTEFADGAATLMTGTVRDITERRLYEERLQLMNRELHHRVKNLFAVIKGLVSASARRETDAKTLATKLRLRLDALAAAHVVSMDDGDDRTASLHRIVEAVIAPYERDEGQVHVQGPALALPNRAITPVGLVLHELATNALKHGAWAGDGGRVHVAWEHGSAAAGQDVILRWHEAGTGPCAPATDDRRTFGAQLIDASVDQLGGTIERTWHEDGLLVFIRFPLHLPTAVDGAGRNETHGR